MTDTNTVPLFNSPHFILKNMLHISVSIVPLSGSQQDVIRMAKKLRQDSDLLSEEKINLGLDSSTVIYSFHSTSPKQPASTKWVAFTVNAARSRRDFKSKWHLIPVEKAGTSYYGEHDGLHTTMCGILEVKAHSSDGGAMVVSISHAATPPFRIENRSNTHFLQFVQDDDDAVSVPISRIILSDVLSLTTNLLCQYIRPFSNSLRCTLVLTRGIRPTVIND